MRDAPPACTESTSRADPARAPIPAAGLLRSRLGPPQQPGPGPLSRSPLPPRRPPEFRAGPGRRRAARGQEPSDGRDDERENAGAGNTAIAAGNVQGRFYRSMLVAFAAQGKARVYQYRFNERIVAMDLCIVGGGALIILKTTYDEAYKAVSPAFLMREQAFRQLFEKKEVDRIEFYGKVMEWHTRWTDEVRTMYHVNRYRWPAISATRRLVRLAKSS